MNGCKGEYRPILGPDGRPITIGRIVPDPAAQAERPKWQHQPDHPTHQSFFLYCEWRKTKCRLRDVRHIEQHLEEMDEATHQFVGEVAELGELLMKHDVGVLMVPEHRAKLIDEIGDIFFCGLWLLDAYQMNPFRHVAAPPPRAIQTEEELETATLVRDALEANGPAPLPDEGREKVLSSLMVLSWQMGVSAGLLCNFFKKIRWQQRAQPRDLMAKHACNVLCLSAHILRMANATVEDSLARNIEKLDTRFPDGYTVPGGGIREGKGA